MISVTFQTHGEKHLDAGGPDNYQFHRRRSHRVNFHVVIN